MAASTVEEETFEESPPVTKIGDVFAEVTKNKDTVEKIYYKIDVLERQLAWKDMDDEERTKLEKELIELKTGVKKLEEQIKGLNAENLTNHQIGTLVILMILCIYGILRVYEIEHTG